MGKTKIEWTKRSWNPVTGCLNGCSYCYARKMARRLAGRYGYPLKDAFRPTFHKERLGEPYKIRKPTMFFVCSMGELFGDWVPKSWTLQVLKVIEENDRHIFQLLTKCPENMLDYEQEIPWNAWLGVSVESQKYVDRITVLKNFNFLNVKFVSFEPLLGEVDPDLEGVDWVIIGAQTQPYKPPKREWVGKIHREANDLDIPVFLKNNLEPVVGKWAVNYYQNFPRWGGLVG